MRGGIVRAEEMSFIINFSLLLQKWSFLISSYCLLIWKAGVVIAYSWVQGLLYCPILLSTEHTIPYRYGIPSCTDTIILY